MRSVEDHQKKRRPASAGSFAELAKQEQARKKQASIRNQARTHRAKARQARKNSKPTLKLVLAAIFVPYLGAGLVYALAALIRTFLGMEMEGGSGKQYLEILKAPLTWPYLVGHHTFSYGGMQVEDFLALAVFLLLLLLVVSKSLKRLR